MKFLFSFVLLTFALCLPQGAYAQSSCSALAASCRSQVGVRSGAQTITKEMCDGALARCRSACKNGKSVFVGPNTGRASAVNSCS